MLFDLRATVKIELTDDEIRIKRKIQETKLKIVIFTVIELEELVLLSVGKPAQPSITLLSKYFFY